MNFICHVCKTYKTENFRILLNHLRYVHSADASFFVLCNINSCKSRFTSLRTYRRHIISKHKWFWQKNWGGKSDKISDEESEVEDFEDTAATSDYDTSVKDSALEEIPKEVDFEDLVSEFLLKLREVKKVSGVACNSSKRHIGNN